MKNLIAFCLVLLVGAIAISTSVFDPSVMGQHHKRFGPWEEWRMVNASSPYGADGRILQKPRQMYQDSFHRCRQNAIIEFERCEQRYDRQVLAKCEYGIPCPAAHDKNNCLMWAQAMRRNCGRFRTKVLHDLSYGKFYYGNFT